LSTIFVKAVQHTVLVILRGLPLTVGRAAPRKISKLNQKIAHKLTQIISNNNNNNVYNNNIIIYMLILNTGSVEGAFV